MNVLLAASTAVTMQSRLILIIFAGLFILAILELIRRHKLQERYTVLWLVAGTLLIAVGVFPDILSIPNNLIGLRTPGLAIFAIAFIAMLLVVLHLTVMVSKQGEQITRLAQEMAIERAQRQLHDTSQSNTETDQQSVEETATTS